MIVHLFFAMFISTFIYVSELVGVVYRIYTMSTRTNNSVIEIASYINNLNLVRYLPDKTGKQQLLNIK